MKKLAIISVLFLLFIVCTYSPLIYTEKTNKLKNENLSLLTKEIIVKNILLNYFTDKLKNNACNPSSINCDIEENLNNGIIPKCSSVLENLRKIPTRKLEEDINNILNNKKISGKITILNVFLGGSVSYRKKIPINITLSVKYDTCEGSRDYNCIVNLPLFDYDKTKVLKNNTYYFVDSSRGQKMNVIGTVTYPELSCGSCCGNCYVSNATFNVVADDIYVESIFNKNYALSCLVDGQSSNNCKQYLSLDTKSKTKNILILGGGCSCSGYDYYGDVIVNLHMNIDYYKIYTALDKIIYKIKYEGEGKYYFFDVIIKKEKSDEYIIEVVRNENKIINYVYC